MSGISPAQYKSEASQHGSSGGCEPPACRTRQGYRCNPVTLPTLPKVGSRLRGTFALSYGSDLLPLGDTFSLQAVDPVFRAHCFSKETCGCCHVLGRLLPRLSARFRCTDVVPVAFGEILPSPATSKRTNCTVASLDLSVTASKPPRTQLLRTLLTQPAGLCRLPCPQPPADLRSCAVTNQDPVTDPGTDGEICLTAWSLAGRLLGAARPSFHEEPDSFD